MNRIINKSFCYHDETDKREIPRYLGIFRLSVLF